MLKMSRLTDYGTGVLAYLASTGEQPHSASEVAEQTGLPTATVSKVLKVLTRSGLVVSHRGSQGGYALSRPAAQITAAEVIDALEGPVALTECSVQAAAASWRPRASSETPGSGSTWHPARAGRDQPGGAGQYAGGHRPRVNLRNIVSTPGKLARLERG
jgi:FeS assembly SUF system regulator